MPIVPATTLLIQDAYHNFNQHAIARDNTFLVKKLGTGVDVAQWTFAVTPGVYRVSATWPGLGLASTAAPFLIYDGGGSGVGTLRQTTSGNQRSRPDDFLNDDTFWADLGIPVTVTSNSLVIELSDNFANGVYVSADAIRIERITDPEITVTNSGASLVDGTSSVSFGVTAATVPVTQTFIVQNFGARNMFVDDASLAASVAALPGFSLTTNFTSTEIAPGGSSVFQITLDATTAGRFNGTIEFATDDFDEQLFSIDVSGDVLDGAAQVIDDGDFGAGFEVPVGVFHASYVPVGAGFGGDALTSNSPTGGPLAGLFAGSATDTATWTFTGLATNELYRLSATWLNVGPFAASDAKFEVYAGTMANPLNTLLATVEIDQTLNPDDFAVGGSFFDQLMGPFQLTFGDQLTVQLTDDANGFVVADAIRLDALMMSEMAVSEGGNALTSGSSTVSYGPTEPGTSVPRTITVTNNGNAALNLNAIQLPNGFTSDFQPVVVAVGGASTTFDITLDAAATGDFFGDVVLTTDDPNQSEFSFAINGTVTNVRIVDDGDAGYTPVGFQTLSAGPGFLNDVSYPTAPGGAGIDTATWTFSGLTNGVYRVSATWQLPGNPNSNNAPFSIYDAATATGAPVSVIIDQTQAPNDFSDDGVFWEDLGGPFTITNASGPGVADGFLTVQLTDQANGRVLADAIRVEPVTTPEIAVTLTAGGANIADGGRVDFGEIALGAAAAVGTINVTVTNTGSDEFELLRLDEVFVPTNGFTVTGYTPGTTLAAGASTDFNIVLSTATAGTFAGVVSFGTNDSDESPFDIIVTGTVSDTLIIDNGDAGFVTTVATDWITNSSGFQDDVDAHQASLVATDVATWTFSDLPAGGRYRVSTTWPAAATNATNATYTLTDGSTSQVVSFNQGLAPEDAANAGFGTVSDRGETFVNIGDIYQLDAGATELIVSLSAVADGRVLADAVRIELIDDAEIKVTAGVANTNIQDGGSFSFGTTDTAVTPKTQITFTVTNEGALDLTLDAASLATSVGLTAGYSLFSSFTSTTVIPGGTSTFVVQLDATVAGTFNESFSFTSNDADESPFVINVTAQVFTPVVFDGAATLIIDDGDRTFSSVGPNGGPWPDYGTGGFQGDSRLSAMRDGESATWTASIANGTAHVSATWVPTIFGTDEAAYEIYDGDGTGAPLATIVTNQRKDPLLGLASDEVTIDGFTADGANWDELGEFTFATGTITVRLLGTVGRHTVADAIRISASVPLNAEEVGQRLPTERDLMFENLPAIFDVAIDTWAASGQATSEQIEQMRFVFPIITDLPGTQVGKLDGSVMYLDKDAAGNGWFVDQTPDDSSEFNTLTALTERIASGNSHAVGDIDLLTVVLHEFGHVLGNADLDPASNPHDLMAGVLPTGVRRLPESVNATTSTASGDVVVNLPATNGHVDVSLFDQHLVVQSNHTILERIDVSSAQTLTFNGTEGADNFRIDLDQSGTLNLTAIFVHGYGDDDEIVLDGVPQLMTGSVAIDGGSGNDRVEVRGGQRTSLTLTGSDGNDSLFGGMGAESIDGGAGDDMLFGGSGNDRINGGTGNDLIQGNTGDDTLVGNDGDDNIHGGSGHDVLTGGAGNDNLSGQGGNDTLIGHDGDDVLNGGAGRDALSGGAGQDQLRGGSQNDLLVGGLGNDELQGNSGRDTLAGEDGDDSLNGGHGDDAVDGGAGNNFIFGREAVDSLFGASALREELLQNPQTPIPALAAGTDTFIAAPGDTPTTPENDTENDPTPTPTADTNFNLFAEWIDLV